MTLTWNIRGIQHQLGDDVFIASGLVFQKVERFRIIKPQKGGGGWLFGGRGGLFAWATNGKEVVRISQRGRIVDDLIRRRRVLSFEEGLRLENEKKPSDQINNHQIDPALTAQLDECDTSVAKVRLLLKHGWSATEIASFLNLRTQLVIQIDQQTE